MIEILLIIIILILLNGGNKNEHRNTGGNVRCNPLKFKKPPILRKKQSNSNVIITKHKPKPPKKAFGMNVKSEYESK